MHQYLYLSKGIKIPLYNLFIGIGVTFAFLYLDKQLIEKKIDFNKDRYLYYSIIISLFFAFLGAKLADIFNKNLRVSLNNFYRGGFTFYGGLIFGIIAFFIMNNFFDLNNRYYLNLLVPSLVLAHAWGRIGCFFAGCCFGKPTGFILGVVFPENSLASLKYGVGTAVHPTQLYEAFFLFILFFILISKVFFKKRISVYLISYSIFRFFIEYLRGDNRGYFFLSIFSPSQIISVFMLIIGFILFQWDSINCK